MKFSPMLMKVAHSQPKPKTHLKRIGNEDNDLKFDHNSTALWQDKPTNHVFSISAKRNDEGFVSNTTQSMPAWRIDTWHPIKNIYTELIYFFDHAPKAITTVWAWASMPEPVNSGSLQTDTCHFRHGRVLTNTMKNAPQLAGILNFADKLPNFQAGQPSWKVINGTNKMTAKIYTEQPLRLNIPRPGLSRSCWHHRWITKRPLFGSGLRFVYRFDQPEGLQWRQKQLSSRLGTRIWKVHRENIIRTKFAEKHLQS